MRTLPRLGSRLVEARQTIRAWARVRGLEVGRAHPDMSLAHFLPTILRRYDISYVLDVGAHHGEFSTILRRHGYNGYIVSFEPVREHFAELRRRASGDPKWMVHHMALGSENSRLQINVARGGSGCSSFLSPSEYGSYATGGRVLPDHLEDVEVRRLDCVADEILPTGPAQNVYLKLDTQGYDLEVIKGAGHVLERIPALQSEMSIQPIYDGMPGFSESIGMLNEYGYDISAMFPVKRDDGLRLVEFDCIMVRGHAPNGATRPRDRDALVR
jgi:FkbM family methyltransferase